MRRPAWAPGYAKAGGPCRSRALPDPEADEGEAADADQQRDEALRDRAHATERRPAGVRRVLDPAGYVRDDVGHLTVGQVAREARHVGRSGAHRLDDLLRGDPP